MVKLIGMLYGLICYILGIVSLLGLILFANNHWGVFGIEALTSLNIDQYNSAPTSKPLLVNIGLLLLFGVQHSVMARPGFKAALTKVIPDNWERSTYVLATAVVTVALVQYWQPMQGHLWRVENEVGRLIVNVIFYSGWIISVLATHMLNHNHLFGLQQSFQTSDPHAGTKEFRTPYFYKFVRHPIQTGVAISLIATPDMTIGRAVFAAGMLLYIMIGLHYEERDLIREFGDTYRDYKQRVPGLIPFLSPRRD